MDAGASVHLESLPMKGGRKGWKLMLDQNRHDRKETNLES
jgi:hypothetical protein